MAAIPDIEAVIAAGMVALGCLGVIALVLDCIKSAAHGETEL